MVEQVDWWIGGLLMYFMLTVGVGAVFAVMPWLSRPETWFAVTVEPGFHQSEPGRNVLRTYIKGIAGLTLLVLLCQVLALWLSDNFAVLHAVQVAGMLFLALGSFAVFVYCRRKVLPFGQSRDRQREVSLEPPLTARQIIPGPVWLQVIPYFLVLAPMSWIALNYIHLPDEVVVHVGIDSITKGEKSIRSVFGGSLLMLFSLLLVHLVMLLPLFVRRLPSQARRSRGINVILMQLMFIMGGIGGFMTFMPLHGETWFEHPLGIGIMMVSALLLLFVPVVTGWFVLRSDGPAQSGDRSPDECWYLGLFYFNPADPALWVEKRFGIGYTVNFARPAAWLCIIGMIALTVVLVRQATG